MRKKNKTIILLASIITVSSVCVIYYLFYRPVWISEGMPLEEAQSRIKYSLGLNPRRTYRQFIMASAIYADFYPPVTLDEMNTTFYTLKNGKKLLVKKKKEDDEYIVDEILIDNSKVTELELNQYK